MYKIEQVQNVPISRDEAWNFFSNPSNLQVVTPDDIGFSFKDDLPNKMYPGLVVSYQVAPLLGMKLNWSTEITAIKEKEYFVDHQLSGPYKIWHHQHFFEDIEGGTALRDIVHYALPLGFIGRMFHPIVVQKKLEEIFAFRKNAIEQKFGILKSAHIL
jgi:ligand-binding SRPBCC domain-containing protein